MPFVTKKPTTKSFDFAIDKKYLRKVPSEITHYVTVTYESGEIPGDKVVISISSVSFKPNVLNYLDWTPALFSEILHAAKEHNTIPQ